MRTCRRFVFYLAFFVFSAFSIYGQETQTQTFDKKVELAKARDLKLTARRLGISIEQLTNARAALKEATDLVMRQDPPAVNDYNTMGRIWLTLNRKEARAVVASMIQTLCNEGQSAPDLDSYRKYTAFAFQLLFALMESEGEKAKQIADMWPEPPSKLGEPGRQALGQFQAEFNARFANLAYPVMDDNKWNQYIQSQNSPLSPFAPRVAIATSLVRANQKEKARQILDQAIVELAGRAPDPSKCSDIEGFLRGLLNYYPERFIDAFEIYKGSLSGQDPVTTPGVIYQLGEERVLVSKSESVAMNMIRDMYGKPDLTLKLLDSYPGLRAKLEPVGGIDRVLNPGSMSISGSPMVRSYPANAPPPPPPGIVPGAPAAGSAGTVAPEKPISPDELFRSLRNKAEANPEAVRRKLMDAYSKKEYFATLTSLAQTASFVDPDLSVIALEVAHGLIPAFENLQQRASSLRSLITSARRIEGEIEPTLLSEGYILVMEMREEEKARASAADQPTPGATALQPSDDMVIFLLTQNALDDFQAALSRIHSISDDVIRIKALMQIALSLSRAN